MPTARWSKDEIVKAVHDGKVVVTRDHDGRYRDLKLSTAIRIFQDVKTYLVVVNVNEIVVQLP